MRIRNKLILTDQMVLEKYYELNTVVGVASFFNKRQSTIREILGRNNIDTANKTKNKINPSTNEKVCTKCLISLPLDSFWLKPDGKYPSRCRSCQTMYNIKYQREKYHNNDEFRKKTCSRTKEYHKKVPEKIKEWSKKWAKNNRDKVNLIHKEYRNKNKEYFKQKAKRSHRRRWDNDPNHREKVINASKERFRRLYQNDEKFRKKMIDTSIKYNKHRSETDELFKFKNTIRKTIYGSFKRMGYTKKSKTYQILGEDWNVVKEYIESQFISGMTWNNYGDWEYDHKIPLCMGNTEEEVIKLNHYTNFRPLWSKENREKSRKVLDEYKHLWNNIMGTFEPTDPNSLRS